MEAPQDQYENGVEYEANGEEEWEGDEEYPDDLKDQDVKIISALEEFWCMPEFTDSMHQIMQEHAHKFTDNEEEQNIECYSIFKTYVKTVEGLLKTFLDEHSITDSELYDWWNRVGQYSTEALSWIDYLLATAEYTDFCSMMVDYKQANEWNTGDQKDDFLSSILNMKMELPSGDKEDR